MYLFGRKQGINEVEQSKIITPEISLGCNMSFDDGSMYHNTKCYSFILAKPSDLAYKFYLSVLNSKILWFFLSNTGYVLRGGYFTFKTNYLYPFPLPGLPETADKFSQKADLMLSLNQQLQELVSKFVRSLQRKFDSLNELSKKIQNCHELTYAEFIKELGKKKIKMGLADEAEWEEYFLDEQTKAKQLAAEIECTDREIDQMVYKLYDLTDDEIAIIEAS